MRMALLRMRAAALAALAWGSACGGNVVVDGMPDGSGGAGATSSSAVTSGVTTNGATGVGAVGVGGSSGSAVGVGGSSVSAVSVGVTGVSAVSVGSTTAGGGGMGTSGSSSTGAGGSDVWSKCVGFCERYEEACGGLEPGQCGTMCDTELDRAPRCNERLIPYFDCMNDRFDCDLDAPRCQRFLNEFNACVDRDGCAEVECAGDPNGACTCKGACQGFVVTAECRSQGFGRTLCSCFVNGEEMASCEDRGETCELGLRCCGAYFEALR
ncbi:hypothetical protein WME79_29305 [Sorangium sp. So ce726]|uniref:hypothetical protein n=1 Tax=Sorangium sp. So ce726 TaxID=3133319 RepID=UPI003F60F9D1